MSRSVLSPALCVLILAAAAVRAERPLELTNAPGCLPLPCKLNNGCVCDHSLPHFNVVDLQYYGTCVSCATGWSGWDCTSVSVQCVNGGVFNATVDKCVCAPGFSGETCAEKLCLAMPPSGSPAWRPPNATTNICGPCATGWGGPQCDICTHPGLQCPFTAQHCQPHALVTPSVNVSSVRSACSITSPQIDALLGNGRAGVTSTMAIDCDFNASSPTASTCSATLYRNEPNGSYQDRFFSCAMRSCVRASSAESTTVTCAATGCACAPDSSAPVRFEPQCQSSLFAQFLAAMTGSTTLSCVHPSTVDGPANCTFAQENFPVVIPLACHSADCKL